MSNNIVYKNIHLQLNDIHLKDSLKFAGLKISDYPILRILKPFTISIKKS